MLKERKADSLRCPLKPPLHFHQPPLPLARRLHSRSHFLLPSPHTLASQEYDSSCSVTTAISEVVGGKQPSCLIMLPQRKHRQKTHSRASEMGEMQRGTLSAPRRQMVMENGRRLFLRTHHRLHFQPFQHQCGFPLHSCWLVGVFLQLQSICIRNGLHRTWTMPILLSLLVPAPKDKNLLNSPMNSLDQRPPSSLAWRFSTGQVGDRVERAGVM
ncbi:hypothetical protein HJG60_011907 [Phyllostomus discolor]|uniref:Uncharacterized protein n=1 Tax=Phyllostomus discolor TaxID=89673 RepID=A0A833ZLR7_9CHIR|nr:hypothetical protein HJG60_011907 [Phyllostomus discolor]